MTAEVHVLVVAAGRGSRFGSEVPKQYLALAGRTVLEHAIQPFLDHPAVIDVTVVVAADDERFGALSGLSQDRLRTAVGGPERAHSVLNGLHTLLGRGVAEDALVMVHDGARPCVCREEIDALLALGEGILAIRESDTLKRTQVVDAVRRVEVTVDRTGLQRALTPQCFQLGRLSDALSAAVAIDPLPSDEAQAIEAAGGEVAVARGRPWNIKVTTPDDLVLAAAVLAARSEP
jgi:2-C-methyl-D-erythritol 4-phosphate cytidylyltransferase